MELYHHSCIFLTVDSWYVCFMPSDRHTIFYYYNSIWSYQYYYFGTVFFASSVAQEVSNDMHDGAMSALSKADMRRNPCVDMRGCTEKDAIAGLCSAV